jgi:hypothetical protein
MTLVVEGFPGLPQQKRLVHAYSQNLLFLVTTNWKQCVSFIRWTNKDLVTHLCRGILCSHQKEWSTVHQTSRVDRKHVTPSDRARYKRLMEKGETTEDRRATDGCRKADEGGVTASGGGRGNWGVSREYSIWIPAVFMQICTTEFFRA